LYHKELVAWDAVDIETTPRMDESQGRESVLQALTSSDDRTIKMWRNMVEDPQTALVQAFERYGDILRMELLVEHYSNMIELFTMFLGK